MAQKYIPKPGRRFNVLYVDLKKLLTHLHIISCFLVDKSVQGIILQFLPGMYSNLESYLQVKGGLSNSIMCYISTGQGDVSSPIIYILCINDLLTLLRQM